MRRKFFALALVLGFISAACGGSGGGDAGVAFEAEVDKSFAAKTTAEAQVASGNMQKVLMNQEYIVIGLAGAFRIYGMSKNVTFTDPHPSFTNQTWFSLGVLPK